MANDDVRGQVVDDSGSAVSGATVVMFEQDDVTNIAETTTDSNGNYVFDNNLISGDGPWHVVARYDDGNGDYNAFSKPYVSATIESAIPDSGLLHQWMVSDGTYPIADSVGGNDLTQGSGGSFVSGGYYEDYGYETDGVDDYAEAQEVVEVGSFTVSWFVENAASFDTDNWTIFCNGNEGIGEHWPRLYTYNNEWRAVLSGEGEISTDGASDDLTHLVARCDGSTLSLVVDTVEEDSLTVGGSPPSLTQPPTLGAGVYPGGSPTRHNEQVADWGLFYDEWKTDAEIQEIYDFHPRT